MVHNEELTKIEVIILWLELQEDLVVSYQNQKHWERV